MMKMVSMRSTSSAAIEAIELTSDFTRFPMLPQYLISRVKTYKNRDKEN